MLQSGYIATYHQFSVKQLGRYVKEFDGRHNQRPLDIEDQMVAMMRGSLGKRSKYEDLVA